MRILITRPKTDAGEFRARLEALGHQVMAEPLMDIVALPIEKSALEGAQGLIATSRNGLRALAASDALPAVLDRPLFAVGAATAEQARSMGFRHVVAGPGTGRELVPIIAGAAGAQNGPLVHVAGEVVAYDLAAPLGAHGLDVRKITAYRAVAATHLSTETHAALRAGTIETVILMSPRTAAIFAQLAGTTELKETARRLTYLCLSAGVAEKLAPLAPRHVVIASEPDTQAILEALTGLVLPSSGV